MRACFLSLMLCVTTAIPAMAQSGSIPDLMVEVTFATEGPLSLYSVPDGNGLAFSEAYRSDGSQTDGTLTMILFVNSGQGYEPVANYPSEDIWLMGEGAGLNWCPGGTCPDSSTDSHGMTHWVQPLSSGGQTLPEMGERVRVVVNGDPLASGILPDLRLNSPDINGDLIVNLTDINLFADDFYGAYDYRSDFVWDGLVNLSDLVPLAETWGAVCP